MRRFDTDGDLQKIRTFLFDRITEAAAVSGVVPEGEGGAVRRSGSNLRLRVGFRGFSIVPSSDCGHIVRGEIIAEILYVPGETLSADILADQMLEVFRPGHGEVGSSLFRVLTSGSRLLDLKSEGKYLRSGLSFDIAVWKRDEF